MSEYTFNINPVTLSNDRVAINNDLIEGSPNLRRASLANAMLFGGPAIRQALESAPIAGDRKHITVDTKVSMLMPGWYPAIPGWHTDGVPRGAAGDPADNGMPSMELQQKQHDEGYFPRFHTIILGNPCLTQFMVEPVTLILLGETRDLYTDMTDQVSALKTEDTWCIDPPVGAWTSWDWWNIHTATEAQERGWRLLIRITESDYMKPAETDFIRTQNQVYVPTSFGW